MPHYWKSHVTAQIVFLSLENVFVLANSTFCTISSWSSLYDKILAGTRQNLSWEFSDKASFKPVSSATMTSQKIEISSVASLHILLSKKRITMALIRLCGCTGWSVPVVLANPEDRFSRVKAHIYLTISRHFMTIVICSLICLYTLVTCIAHTLDPGQATHLDAD